MQQPRNVFSTPVISDSDRARHQQGERAREQEHQAALQLDVDYAQERQAQSARARDAGNGVNVVSGRGNWPPSAQEPGLQEANSIIGIGSTEYHTGVATPLTFASSVESDNYASLLTSAAPIDSGVGKHWVGKDKMQMYKGNPGIRCSATLGICALKFVEQLMTHHANHTHTSQHARKWGLRHDMLANMTPEIRANIENGIDENASWRDLVLHFLQTCGPQDIHAAVESMIAEASLDTPARTLRQRTQAITSTWRTAQVTYFGSNPEYDNRNLKKPPHFCAPFIHTFDQHKVLKGLLNRSNPHLWDAFCGRTDRRVRTNLVVLLNFILDLDTDAVQAIVTPAVPSTFANIRTGASRRTDAYPTSGENITMPIAQVKTLEARATTSDAVLESNRVAYEASRAGGVTGPPGKWCLAAGISQEQLDYRHEHHLGYYCGEHVRNGNLIVHTFWHCPKRLLVHDAVEALMARSGAPAPSDRYRPTQREFNERRRQSSGSAHQDADQDQSFRRNTSRDHSHQQWGRDPHPVPHGQERGFNGQASPRQGSRYDERRSEHRGTDDNQAGDGRSSGRDTRDSRRNPPQDGRRDGRGSEGRGNGRDGRSADNRSSRRDTPSSRDPSQEPIRVHPTGRTQPS